MPTLDTALLRINKRSHSILKRLAEKQNTTMSAIFENMLEDYDDKLFVNTLDTNTRKAYIKLTELRKQYENANK